MSIALVLLAVFLAWIFMPAPRNEWDHVAERKRKIAARGAKQRWGRER